ncbi:MAG: cytidylyltransferase domain-containing protein [Chitinophagales bacterium]
MIEGKKVLAIIPARGGSKTLPRKNLKILAGKPLIAWTIEEAHKSSYLDRVILSSEDEEIIEVAREWDCEVPFIRPLELAGDETPGIEPILHAIVAIKEKYDYLAVLQPTSPLRTVFDIDECIRFCIKSEASTCASVSQVNKHPFWMFTLDEKQYLSPLMAKGRPIDRRQDLPPVFVLNGAIYVARTNYLLETKSLVTEETLGYIMPLERSWDIDNELDLRICTLLKALSPLW